MVALVSESIPTPASRKAVVEDLLEYGHICRQENRLAAAEQCFEEALLALEKTPGGSKELQAYTLRNLARICKMQGKLAESSLLEDRADRLGDDATPLGGSSGFWALLGVN
ncbi:MAG: tetratricopeptide repeat protein [Candidatus Obscuribacterales bacterium]